MRLNELARALELADLTPAVDSRTMVTRAHVSDLLSDVLANAPAGGLLVTIQAHMNVIAVALNAGLVAVIFAGEHHPPADVVARSVGEGLKLYQSERKAFDLVGELYGLGLRGNDA